jgi:hypothetical protein
MGQQGTAEPLALPLRTYRQERQVMMRLGRVMLVEQLIQAEDPFGVLAAGGGLVQSRPPAAATRASAASST